MNLRKIGIFQILLSGLCFGFLGFFGKKAYELGLTPGELLSFRFSLGSLLLFVYLLARSPQILRLSKKELISCSILGVLGYAIFSSCFFMALQGISASLTVLLLYTYPVLVAIGGWIFFGEKIPKNKWIALPIVMLGLVGLIWGDFKIESLWYLAFGLASALFYAIYILASSHWLKNTDSLAATTYIQLSAGIALSILHFQSVERSQSIFELAWPTLLAMALVCSAMAMSLFLAGLKKLKSWEASILSTAEPISGILIAILLLGEQLSWMQIAGGLAVLAGLTIVSKP